jgi:hypothetical protein
MRDLLSDTSGSYQDWITGTPPAEQGIVVEESAGIARRSTAAVCDDTVDQQSLPVTTLSRPVL